MASRRPARSHALWMPAAPGRGKARRGPDLGALESIWNVVARIPAGSVTTYGAVARAAGLPGRARQAGFALRHAGADLNLPWHRVVGAGGRIALPPSSRGFREQVRRLKSEGVAVRSGRVAAASLTDLAEL